MGEQGGGGGEGSIARATVDADPLILVGRGEGGGGEDLVARATVAGPLILVGGRGPCMTMIWPCMTMVS